MLRRTYRLGGLGAVTGVDLGRRLGPKRASPHRRAWKVRPHDLLVFDIELVNLRVAPSEDPDTAATLEKDGDGVAFLILVFPPQSLVEKAYYTTEADDAAPDPDPEAGEAYNAAVATETGEDPQAPPIPALQAGWSRLAFIVPDEKLPIDWTIPGILGAVGGLELSVAPNALPRREAPRRIHPWLDALVHPHAMEIQAAALATAAGVGSGSAPLESRAQTFVTARAGGGTLLAARDRRTIRTIGYTLGLTEISGSATAGFVDELIQGELILPVELTRPIPREPAATHTALELPWRVILSPNRHGAWLHSADPVASEVTGHTELWHTRLGVRQADGEPEEGPDPLRTVRAIWATDPNSPPITPSPGDQVDVPPLGTGNPFRASLDAFDRHNVVHLSSNFRLKEVDSTRWYEPAPIDVDSLMLSSLGAWLDSRGVWEQATMPDGLAVEEWRHRATLGRDHYVRVVYAGRLYPTQHRASLIKVTERRFHRSKPGNAAYLRQMFFIVPRERLRVYRNSKLTGPNGRQWDLELPFTAARITTVASPLLDDPADTMIQDAGCFWPFVKSQPFRFTFVATDTDGREVDLAMPVIFVGQQHTDDPWADSVVRKEVAKDYREKTWPGSSQLRAEVPLGGQSVAFARAGSPDDTTYAVRSITFDAGIPEAATYDKLPKREPRFVPIMRQAKVDVPSLQRIAKTTEPAAVVYPEAYLIDEFAGANAGEVFLAADTAVPQLKVGFGGQADRSGGFVAPDLSLSGLSRVTGPVSGPIASAIGGNVVPSDWFGALVGEARLFGVLELRDILEEAGFDEIDKIPRFVGETLDDVGRLIARIEELHRLLAANPVPQASAVIATLDALTDPSTGSIPGLLTGGDPAAVAGQLATLHGQLGALPAALAGATGLGTGMREVLARNVAALTEALDAFDPGLLARFAAGDFLPEAFAARFEWRPELKDWPPVFHVEDKRGLVVLVEAVGDELVVTAALDRFVIDLEVLVLTFNRILFRSRNGRKPEIDVDFEGYEFAGPLAFIETLRDLIPLDGFADPPEVTVTPEGITAGFSQGLPNIAVGVFSLENLSLAAGFSVPFVGPPMSTWFRFCERENPARLTVSLFGGGFFFGIVVDAKGLQVAEGAIEFGAAVSVDFGVASGSVSAMAGLYFKIEGSTVTLAGYFRMRGEVEALGIVSVCIELYLEMLYESGSNKCVGTATISIEVEVALFSATVSITATKKFAGSGADPTLADVLDIKPDMTSDDWNAYCAAFAA
jgi:hypothetical protein